MQIHELNNFTGTLGAGAYLAVDDGNDTGKLSTQQLLAATEARIDNIIKEYVTPEMFGAKGDGVTDDTTALKDAFQNKKVWLGNNAIYKITDTIPVYSEIIEGNNAVIDCKNTGWLLSCLSIAGQTNLKISNVSILCNDNVSIGIYFSTAYSADPLEKVEITGCTISDTNNKNNTKSSLGIFIDRQNISVIVKGCIISNIKRNTSNVGVIASCAIHVGEICGSVDVSDNVVNGVYYASDQPYDADGIQLYTHNRLSSSEEDTSMVVSNNVVTQCQGRFIKIQGEGATVQGNKCKNIGLDINPNFVGVDLQTGKGVCANNTVELINCTGHASAKFFNLSSGATTKRQSIVVVDGNNFYASATIRFGLSAIVEPALYSTLIISNNRIENTTSAVALSASSALAYPFAVLINNNALYSFTDLIEKKDALVSDTKLFVKTNNNYGTPEAVVAVPNTISTINELMSTVYGECYNIGSYTVNVNWQSHGTFTGIINRYSTTRADVFLLYSGKLYHYWHYDNSTIYLFTYEATTSTQY